jgi:ABC-type multidrug transport system fused ATPase/permease subunit
VLLASEDNGAARRRSPDTIHGGRLEYHDVTFWYSGSGRPVLDGVTLKVEPGETVGVAGPSGAGKSTLLALAGRYYDLGPGGGEIRLNGRDVRDIDPATLRRTVALVPQQAVLFAGTIRSNLMYASGPVAETDLWRVLEAVDLADMAAGLPDGLETAVGERGFTLSGGQRQRLALARAMLTSPAILLLDDCTSGLDAATEARVHTAVGRSPGGTTRLIVSHKAATLRRCDRVVSLCGGRILETNVESEFSTADARQLA